MLVPTYSVEELAKKKGVSMAQISIAWSLSKDGTSRLRPHCLLLWLTRCLVVSAPIVGTTSLKHLEDMVGQCPLLPSSPVPSDA